MNIVACAVRLYDVGIRCKTILVTFDGEFTLIFESPAAEWVQWVELSDTLPKNTEVNNTFTAQLEGSIARYAPLPSAVDSRFAISKTRSKDDIELR